MSSATLPFENNFGGIRVRFESRLVTVSVFTMNLAAPMMAVKSLNDVFAEVDEHLKSSPSLAASQVQGDKVSVTNGHFTSSRISFCHCWRVVVREISSVVRKSYRNKQKNNEKYKPRFDFDKPTKLKKSTCITFTINKTQQMKF